jgi:septal ring factor EnvC (AmiA/AmiB activator)
MNMSRLENFINSNRDYFDGEMPSERIWQKLEKEFPEKKEAPVIHRSNSNHFVKWAMAASVAIAVATAGYFLLQKKQLPDTAGVNTQKPAADTSTDIASIAPEAAPEVNEFARLIASKQEELKQLSKDQPELYQKFTADINQLDSSYTMLKKQLAETPNRELLLEAMIRNLQFQLNVLNRQLNIINQVKQTIKKV